MDTATYSVWAMPTDGLKKELQTAIDQLAKSYGGPVFEPHVTILGSIPHLSESEAKRKAKELAKAIKPYDLIFEELQAMPEYYRALIIRMQHTKQALDAFHAAQKVFGYTDYADHLVHMSLFYGHLMPEEKNRMMGELFLKMGQSFHVDTLHLYKKPGEALEWTHVESMKMAKK